MGIAWLVKGVIDNRLVWWSSYIFINLLCMYYIWSIHPKIFKPKPNGTKAIICSLIGFGFGQLYNRQLVKGVILQMVALISFGIMLALKNTNDNLVVSILLGLILVPMFDAGIGAQSARVKIMKLKREGDVKKKVKEILQYHSDGYELGLDTNFFMHEPDLLVDLLTNHQIKVYVSMQVFNELDGLKKNENPITRKQAQVAFDVIEAYQKQNKLILVNIPHDKYLRQAGLGNSPDEKIIGSYLLETNQDSQIILLSNDKGARIIARNAGLPVADIA